jgi:hypothetical protein
MTRIADILPAFCDELRRSLTNLNRGDLVAQLPQLTLERWTLDRACCALYIYVGGTRPLNFVEQTVIGIKPGESIPLKECDGPVVVDTDNFGRFRDIEVLHRRDVLKALKRAKPPERPGGEASE